jgi:hypothetical protein
MSTYNDSEDDFEYETERRAQQLRMLLVSGSVVVLLASVPLAVIALRSKDTRSAGNQYANQSKASSGSHDPLSGEPGSGSSRKNSQTDAGDPSSGGAGSGNPGKGRPREDPPPTDPSEREEPKVTVTPGPKKDPVETPKQSQGPTFEQRPKLPPDAVIDAVTRDLFAWFRLADNNKDGFLDEQELAWAFRGKTAKPPDTKGLSPQRIQQAYPDAWFRAQVDENNDGRIDGKEFQKFADTTAAQVKQAKEYSERIQRLEESQLLRQQHEKEADILKAQLNELAESQRHIRDMDKRAAAPGGWAWVQWYTYRSSPRPKYPPR